jgi:hypothetical protein
VDFMKTSKNCLYCQAVKRRKVDGEGQKAKRQKLDAKGEGRWLMADGFTTVQVCDARMPKDGQMLGTK